MRAEWRQRAGDLRFDLSAVPRVQRVPSLSVSDGELAGSSTLDHATFERNDVVRETAKAARQGASLDEIIERADAFLVSDQAVQVGVGRWSTPEIIGLERSIVDRAGAPLSEALRADPWHVSRAVSERPSLSGEQEAMVQALCGSGRAIDVVIGRAGAGKTFTLDAVREAFEASGHRVLGVSLAARAARELEAGAGIRSSTAHALQNAVDSGRGRLREGDVLVVDEAGMLGTRLMAALVDEAARAEAKVILVGDPKQLPPVEAGGLFASLAERVPVVELVENRRQQHSEERVVADALRFGRTELAVRRLDRHGHVHTGHNSDTIRTQMVIDWWGHRETGADVVMGAPHRSDARDLNARAHAALEAEGRLGPLRRGRRRAAVLCRGPGPRVEEPL